jgi:hypothetical protein
MARVARELEAILIGLLDAIAARLGLFAWLLPILPGLARTSRTIARLRASLAGGLLTDLAAQIPQSSAAPLPDSGPRRGATRRACRIRTPDRRTPGRPRSNPRPNPRAAAAVIPRAFAPPPRPRRAPPIRPLAASRAATSAIRFSTSRAARSKPASNLFRYQN